jgi:Uma2 family endonuclease
MPGGNPQDLFPIQSDQLSRIQDLVHSLLCYSKHPKYHEAMSGSPVMTFEQFENVPEDGLKHELLQGQHVVFLPDTIRRSNIRHAIHHLLFPYVRQHHLGEVFIAAGFLLSPDTFLHPAACFIRTAQLERTDPDGYLAGAPAVAIEIASESNTAAQLDRKMEQYFAHGSEEIWIVYPETRKIRIYFPDGSSRTAVNDLQSNVFPGWSVPLSAVFED